MQASSASSRTSGLPSTSGRAQKNPSWRRWPRKVQSACGGKIVGAQEVPDERWQRLALIRRQLQVAVADQEFQRAAELRDHIAAIRSEMPPSQQFLLHRLQHLEFGNLEEQRSALAAIGHVGGMDMLGEVAEYLKNPDLERTAAITLYHIWHRHPGGDPAIEDLMSQGCKLMMSSRGLSQAEKIFSQIIHIDPAFAEGWNKRATVRFHLGSFQDSIHDCKITIGLNSYHFGAMVGQGFCHMKLHEYRPAVSSFERALQVHPGLSEVREYLGILRKGAEQQEDGSA